MDDKDIEATGRWDNQTKKLNTLSLVLSGDRTFPAGQKIALLANNGEVLPGQTAIHIGEPDRWGVREVRVIFEVVSELPEECAKSVNWK